MGKVLAKDGKVLYNAASRAIVADGNGSDCCCGGGGCDPVACCGAEPHKCGLIPINCPCTGNGCQYGDVEAVVTLAGSLVCGSYTSGSDTYSGWTLPINMSWVHTHAPTQCRYTGYVHSAKIGDIMLRVSLVYSLNNAASPFNLANLNPPTCGPVIPDGFIWSYTGVVVEAYYAGTSDTVNYGGLVAIVLASKDNNDWQTHITSDHPVGTTQYNQCSANTSGGKGSCRTMFVGSVAGSRSTAWGNHSFNVAATVRFTKGIGSCTELGVEADTVGGGGGGVGGGVGTGGFF